MSLLSRLGGNETRFAIAGVMTALAAYFRQIGAAIAILGGVMVLDYITGLIKAYLRHGISSRKGFEGIVKKGSYLIVVASGAICDWVLGWASGEMGVELGFPFLAALLITIWLIVNELISILENLSAIGVPMPGFLMKLVHHLSVAVEHAGNLTSEEESAAPPAEPNENRQPSKQENQQED